jgi:hypothetical protein
MKPYAYAAVLAVLFPLAALADDGRFPPPPPPGGPIGAGVRFEFQGPQGHINIEAQQQDDGQSDVQGEWQGRGDRQGPATDTPDTIGPDASGTPPYMRGEKEGIERRFGTTTPPGMMREEDGSSTPREIHMWGRPSTTIGEDVHGMTEPSAGGPASFFRWLFGLPASTTVGEVQASLEATTTATITASTTPQLPPPPPSMGDFFSHFFERFGGFFGFGQ